MYSSSAGRRLLLNKYIYIISIYLYCFIYCSNLKNAISLAFFSKHNISHYILSVAWVRINRVWLLQFCMYSYTVKCTPHLSTIGTLSILSKLVILDVDKKVLVFSLISVGRLMAC